MQKHRKQKKPSKKMRPSRKGVWTRTARRFGLTPEEQAMAKMTEFTPALMEEVATGRKVKRGMYDKLPSRRATPGQIRRVKHEIRVRYAARFGDAPPPVVVEPAELQRKNKEERLRARGQAKLTVTLPIELRAHVTVECARAGLTLDEGVQAALEARFPRGSASSPPTSVEAG